MKKLIDLRPEWLGVLRPGAKSGEGIGFDCPACGPKHRLAAYFSNPVDAGPPNGGNANWQRNGDRFDSLTVVPSLLYPCWHGWIEGGLVFSAEETPLQVPGVCVGHPESPIMSLSPNQAEFVARQVLERVAELRKRT